MLHGAPRRARMRVRVSLNSLSPRMGRYSHETGTTISSQATSALVVRRPRYGAVSMMM